MKTFKINLSIINLKILKNNQIYKLNKLPKINKLFLKKMRNKNKHIYKQ